MDGLSNKTIKMGVDCLTHPITFLINECFKQSKFPNIFRLFKVIALYKKGDPCDPKNFRPIALLNPISKVLEKEILRQMESHMVSNNLWNDSMYAYRNHFNTINSMIDMVEIWTQNIDAHKQNITMFLDMSSAFDCVSRLTLEHKMSIYNFSQETINLVDSYLNYRSQFVSVGGKKSEILWVKSGVPQGSILGQFFIIFT